MTVNVYRWDDAGAPTLDYVTGSLISVLEACLVDGYGTKAGAGWTRAFMNNNIAAFKQGIGVAAQHFLQVDDYSVNYVKVRGFHAMSSESAGTDQFPSNAQKAIYSLNKGAKTGVPAQWVIIADHRTVYLFFRNETSPQYGWLNYGFGDLFTYQTGDLHACFISADDAASAYSNLCLNNNTSGYTGYPEFLASDHSGNITSEVVRKSFINLGSLNQTLSGDVSSGLVYPNPTNGEAILSPFFVAENVAGNVLRGTMRGLWALCHPQPFGHLDIFNGSGDLTGKQFMAINVSGGSSQYYGQVAVEISDTWATNLS